MKTPQVIARLTAVIFLATGAASCDDGGIFQAETTVTEPEGPSNTFLLDGPADGLAWTPAESPDPATEAQLAAALTEVGRAMVVPTTPPPTGGPIWATFCSQGFQAGFSGVALPGTWQIWLHITLEEPWLEGGLGLVKVYASGSPESCGEGATTLSFRGDDAACARAADDYSVVSWQEGGQPFSASFDPPLSLDEGLSWIETWRLLP